MERRPEVAAAGEDARATRKASLKLTHYPCSEAALFRIKDRYRSVLMIKLTTGEADAAVEQIGAAVKQVASDREHKDVKLAVDVDPQ
jgi:primosomal protein N'